MNFVLKIDQDISKPRQIAMFLSKQLTDVLIPEIGKLLVEKIMLQSYMV